MLPKFPGISVCPISAEIGGCGASSWVVVLVKDKFPSRPKTELIDCLFDATGSAIVALGEKESGVAETPLVGKNVSDIEKGKLADWGVKFWVDNGEKTEPGVVGVMIALLVSPKSSCIAALFKSRGASLRACGRKLDLQYGVAMELLDEMRLSE